MSPQNEPWSNENLIVGPWVKIFKVKILTFINMQNLEFNETVQNQGLN